MTETWRAKLRKQPSSFNFLLLQLCGFVCALTATTWSQPVGPPNVGSLCCTCAPPQTNYSVCVTHTARPRPECSNQSRGPWGCLCLCVFPSQPLGAIIVVTVAEPGGDLPLTSCFCVCVCVCYDQMMCRSVRDLSGTVVIQQSGSWSLWECLRICSLL